ncbi:MAG TPA: malonyl-ACP O-methyltransferase BioC [Steroidobacteraceae bacterium]
MPTHDPYFLDPRLVRRAFDRASATFDANAAVHAELRNRLLQRLDVVKLQPQVVLDLGAGTGQAARRLQDRYRSAYVLAADISVRMLQQARKQQRWFKRFGRVACDAHQLSLQTDSVDLVFSNLMLQWCADPDRVFEELARVLRPNGLLMFTALGPDTLRELRAAWDGDGHVHVHRFIDMHDFGDALVRAGFVEPVMDTERLTVTYRDLDTLLAELKLSGSTNLAHGRPRALRPAHIHRRARERYECARTESVLPVTLEVVYGHAWAGSHRSTPRGSSTVVIPVDRIGRRNR